MKNETEKGRIERWYEKTNGSRPFWIILFAILIIITYLLQSLFVQLVYGGFDKIYSYPENKYELLEDEVNNIIIDNRYIQMDKLSDKDIGYTQTYSRDPGENTGKWDIKLEKDDIEITIVTTESSEGNLQNIKISRNSYELDYNIIKSIAVIGLFVLSVFLGIVIVFILHLFYYVIMDKIVDIERKKRSKKK